MLPAVQSVVINDGSAQRSMVDSITIHFSKAITFSPTAQLKEVMVAIAQNLQGMQTG